MPGLWKMSDKDEGVALNGRRCAGDLARLSYVRMMIVVHQESR